MGGYENEDLELDDRQVARVDEIYNAVFEMCKVLAENPDLEWDMHYIGDIVMIGQADEKSNSLQFIVLVP